jgi:adenylate kinase
VNVLFLGPQGSGKGTQAKRLAEEYGLAHIATGDMLREAISAGTELGRRVQPIVESGALVPDELVVALIRERLAQPDAQDGFILDGFPRTLAQAEALDEMLADIGRDLDVIFEFQISDEVATERMLGRAGEEGRTDDTPDAIERRLRIYHSETEPVVEHYRATGRLVGIPAGGTIPEVYAHVMEAVEQVEGRSSGGNDVGGVEGHVRRTQTRSVAVEQVEGREESE